MQGKSLTDKEIDLLQAIANGENQKDYAARTFYSYQMLKNRLQLTFAKMGANSIAHAVAIAFREGLIK